MTDWQRQHEIDRARIEALEAELDEALERIRQLEAERFNAEWVPPLEMGLTRCEGRLVAALAGREEYLSKEALLDALYSLLPDQDEPQIKIIDVFVCKARKKLEPYGVKIETLWGRGYRMPAESKAILNDWPNQQAA